MLTLKNDDMLLLLPIRENFHYPEMFLNHLSPMFKHDDKASYFPIKEVGTEPVLVAAYRRGKYLNKFHREFIDICKHTYDTENRMWR